MYEDTNYEFSERENEVFSSIALVAKMWGGIAVLSGAPLALLGSESITILVCGIGMCLIGISFWRSGSALRSVVDTEGNDVSHALDGLRHLTKAFRIQVACWVGMTALVVWHTLNS